MADVPLPNIARDMKHQKPSLKKPVVLQETLVKTNDIATRAELRALFGVEPEDEDDFFQSNIATHDGDWRYEVDGIWRFYMTPDVAVDRLLGTVQGD